MAVALGTYSHLFAYGQGKVGAVQVEKPAQLPPADRYLVQLQLLYPPAVIAGHHLDLFAQPVLFQLGGRPFFIYSIRKLPE